MFQMLVAPLSELILTDEERVLMGILCIFAVGKKGYSIVKFFLDIPELTIHGVEILKIIRKKYMDVLYTHILHSYSGSDISEVYAATRVGHFLTLIASITVNF